MADILIRGMKMPKTCYQCDLKIYDPEMRWNENGIKQIGAWVCKRTREIIWNTQRGENCPLIFIPDGHGRLVDAREVLEKADKASWFDGDVSELGLLLGSEVTTIVPAEEFSEE